MDNDELETIDSTNDDLETLDSTNEEQESDTDVDTETPEEYTEREKQYYARIKKLEKELADKGEPKEGKKAVKTDNKLSTFDMLALQKANIETEEDLDEVVRWADYNKISVAEALKSKVLKTVLSEKSEERMSAMAVNTGTGRRPNNGQVSDERLLADAERGIMPNEADIGRLAVLRMKNR